MKKTKIIIPALGILLLSTAASVTGTVAWFSANSSVTAGNMQVKAIAEKGILINEIATANSTYWDNEATTSQAEGIPLRATSTANTKNWFVAYSKSSDQHAGATSSSNSPYITAAGYKALTFAASPSSTAAAAGTNAQTDIYYVDTGASGYQAGEGYYVKYTYYIKSSADAITCGVADKAQNLNIVAPTVTSTTSTSANLDKSIRVAVVVNSKAYIFAPLNSSAGTYYVGTDHTATTPLTGDQPTDLTTIPATTSDGTAVYVYIWFEGEDPNLKTTNITSTLDNLIVSFGFELVTNDGAVTPAGVSVA